MAGGTGACNAGCPIGPAGEVEPMMIATESTMSGVSSEGLTTSQGDGAIPRARAALCWVLQIVAAAILFQTLFFKFAAAEESVYIFSTLGLEPWGRIGSGVAELIACVLLLVPRTVPAGALLALGVMSGALVSHLTKLGIVVRDDGGLLFGLAVTVFLCSVAILSIRRRQVSSLVPARMRARHGGLR